MQCSIACALLLQKMHDFYKTTNLVGVGFILQASAVIVVAVATPLLLALLFGQPLIHTSPSLALHSIKCTMSQKLGSCFSCPATCKINISIFLLICMEAEHSPSLSYSQVLHDKATYCKIGTKVLQSCCTAEVRGWPVIILIYKCCCYYTGVPIIFL